MDQQFWDEDNFNDEVAKIVSDNAYKNQLQNLTLHGEKSITKKQLNTYDKDKYFNDNELYTTAGKTIVVEGTQDKSYCLNGLIRNIVVFKNKINHLMIRNSTDTVIYLNRGTISGIDILKGCNVSVRSTIYNFANVEQSTYTTLGGTIDDNTLIHVTNSMDVFVNHKNLKVNPFCRSEFKLVYTIDSDQERIDIEDNLFSSPVDRSFPQERPTKLFVQVQTV